MNIKRAFALLSVFGVLFIGVLAYFYIGHGHGVFGAEGIVAKKERGLIIDSILLMLIVVIPVYALTFFFAWHYRAENKNAKYVPNWEHAKIDELIWWAVPFEIILVLGALTWTSTHELDPYKPLASEKKAVTIQVVALPWKWLFIYPEEKIASVNDVEFPSGTPINFQITSDAPMNSFWIPELGGQMYAMTGMVTPLRLEADNPGVFLGRSANYSGEGFAGMSFTAHALSQNEYDAWVKAVQNIPDSLTQSTFLKIEEPSNNVPPTFYSHVPENLFETVVAKYTGTSVMSGMKM